MKKALEEYNEGNLGHNNTDRYNLIAEFKGKSDKTLVFNGHVDTMPIGNKEDWKYNPFGEINEKYLKELVRDIVKRLCKR